MDSGWLWGEWLEPIPFELDLEMYEDFQAILMAMLEVGDLEIEIAFMAYCAGLLSEMSEKTAFNLLLQEDNLGWLYSVKCGATTIPEVWNAYGTDGSRNVSFNHYSYGAVIGWIFDSVLGIRVEKGKITIRPVTDSRLGSIYGEYDSPFGTIGSGWKYEGNNVICKISIPANCCAEVVLADGRKLMLEAGDYSL